MTAGGLSSADDFLIDAGERYFKATYVNPWMRRNESFGEVGWAPSLQVEIHDHHMIVCEVSSARPYPQMLALRGHDVMMVQIPTSVYCICPEAEFLRPEHQEEVKKLVAHGFGLITVDAHGSAMVRHSAIPLVQRIAEDTFRSEVKSLPPKLRRKVSQCFDSYKKNAGSGVHELAEVIEAVTYRGGLDGVKKTWLDRANVRPGYSANTLDAMHECPQMHDIRAEIGATRGYISSARNPSSHFPKNKKQAFQKYHSCRENFLAGIKILKDLRASLVKKNLSGGLPKI